MAETHEQVVKVWIAPGCIVCDACETDCPEVFEVQEETCVIRPEAQDAEFTKSLTPSIKIAAEGCPVDVIKFETIEVEGPEPWPDQEEEAANQVSGAGGEKGGREPAQLIPQGPPDPKWAQLLADSHIAHRGRGKLGRMASPARVPAAAIAEALPADAPPDARDAAMVGSGFVQPRMSVAERISTAAQALVGAVELTRRQFNVMLAMAWGALAAVGGLCAAALQAFMVPKVTREPPAIFRAGKLSDFPEPGVYTVHKTDHGVWMVNLGDKLVAISTTCTHLGCIPNWLSNDNKFKCPCHGSGFQVTGMNFEGPAPRPLERHGIYLDGEIVVVDKSKKFRQELNQWGLDGSEITI